MYRIRPVAFLILFSTAAFADSIVFEYPPVFTPPSTNLGDYWSSAFSTTSFDGAANDGGLRTYDSFTLTSSATVSEVEWFGTYIATMANGFPGAGSPNTNTWDLTFYNDNSGVPGTVVENAVLSASSVTAVNIGPGLVAPAPVGVFEFTATLPTPVTLSGGVQYWFSPWSLQTGSIELPGDSFFWIQGTGGNSPSFQQQFTTGDSVDGSGTPSHDEAFALLASVQSPALTTPEPASLFLIVLGLAAVGMIRVRKRYIG
jgi:PEP-CTERM motif